MGSKPNLVNLRISDVMNKWLDEQCEILGMTKSEVIRFWLQNSMLTFQKSCEIANNISREQLSGQMSFDDVGSK